MQSVSPEEKIPAQAVGKKKNSCKLKIPLPPPPPITFLMVRPLLSGIGTFGGSLLSGIVTFAGSLLSGIVTFGGSSLQFGEQDVR